MKLAVLFSGGKDSTLALHKAAEKEQIGCLITVHSRNPESYMFHTPNIDVTRLQAEALEYPLITKITEGKKETELVDLEQAIIQSVEQFNIEGIVTGAVESVYQAERIQRICNHLNLWCFNPLWKINQEKLLEELLERQFQTIISGIFAYPLDETWLGKQITPTMISRLVTLQREIGLSPSGEGGEIETTVLDAPLFKKKIEIINHSITAKGNWGVFKIEQARLIAK